MQLDGAGMVSLSDGSNLIAEYQYDSVNRRILITDYDNSSDPATSEVRHLYYSLQSQVIEERADSSDDAAQQYVWNLGYIDDLLLRDRDTNGNSTLDERLYALTDLRYSVMALANSSGTIVERFRYEAHGRSTALTADFASRTLGPNGDGSQYAWEYRYTGRELDLGTGLYYFRARYYHADLGRFISRDPIGYVDGMSLYRAYFVPLLVDPLGFDSGYEYEQQIYRYFLNPLIELSREASNNLDGAIREFGTPIIEGFKSWNDKAGLDGGWSSDVRWKKKWPIGFGGAEINLQGGFGYSVKTDLCCVAVKGYGFGQVEGKSPRIPQLMSGQVVFRGVLTVSGEYKYCLGEFETWSKDSFLKFSVSGGIQWSWDIGAFGFDFKAVIEGGAGFSNKWTIPEWSSENGWQIGFYARGYAEWKPGYWSSYRRRQLLLSYGAPIDVF